MTVRELLQQLCTALIAVLPWMALPLFMQITFHFVENYFWMKNSSEDLTLQKKLRARRNWIYWILIAAGLIANVAFMLGRLSRDF